VTTHQKPQKSLKGDITQHHVAIQAMWWRAMSPFNDFFAVFDPSPLTGWINCSF